MEPFATRAGLLLLLAAPAVGSFLTVLVDRLPRGEGVVLGRSRCRACGRPLGPLDLVPLVGWLLRRGRCRHCGAAIGAWQPATELAALGIAVWAGLAMPAALAWPTAMLGWALLALALIDLRHFLLPDLLTLPLIAGGLLVAGLGAGPDLAGRLTGAAAGGAVLWAVGWIFGRLAGREGLGLGDVKLFAAAGAWVGWQGLASVLQIAALAGLAHAALAGRLGTARGKPVPFGPSLALGLWLTWLYGPLVW